MVPVKRQLYLVYSKISIMAAIQLIHKRATRRPLCPPKRAARPRDATSVLQTPSKAPRPLSVHCHPGRRVGFVLRVFHPERGAAEAHIIVADWPSLPPNVVAKMHARTPSPRLYERSNQQNGPARRSYNGGGRGIHWCREFWSC